MREFSPMLLMLIRHPVAVPFHEGVALGGLQVLAHHLGDDLGKTRLRLPAELGARLRRVAEQRLHLRRTQVAGIERDDAAALPVVALLLRALALPVDPD